MTADTTDWYEWHKGYAAAESLRRRLACVRSHIADGLETIAPGPIRIVSICAGDGRDVISVLRDHPRRGDVEATLLELDPRLVHDGRDLARAADLEGNVEFLRADATRAEAYIGRIPCHLLIACGILGNILPETTLSFVALAAAACETGARLIWTRNAARSNSEAHIETIRQLLAAASFDQVRLDVIEDEEPDQSERLAVEFGAGRHVVTSNVQRATPGALPSGALFTFVGFQALEKDRASAPTSDDTRT
jgi:hypothetical protein